MALQGRSIVIVGMCRSGTSSVAGALAKLGVYFGKPEELYAGDEHNQGGYYEHRVLNAAHRRFQLSLNLTALDVDPMPTDWLERPMTEANIKGTFNSLSKTFSGRDLWGWKDPQASTLLPFVREVFSRAELEPVVVLCVRNPLDVARSQFKRQGTPEPQTLGAWLLSTLAALRDSKGLRRTVVIYEQFLQDPTTCFNRIADQLGIVASADDWQGVADWVKPHLSHGESTASDLVAHTSLIRRTYELCLAAANEPDSLNSGGLDESIESLWSEWLEWHDMLARPSVPEASFGISWERAGQRLVNEATYRPTRSWQVLRGECKALPGSRVSVLLFPLPAVFWIRKAVWHANGETIPAKLSQGSHGQIEELDKMHRVWVFHGYEQLAVDAPIAKGPFELEFEVLIETNNLIAGMTFQELSRQIREA